MTTESLAEIVSQACALEETADKVAYLRKNNSIPLRNILIFMYDNKFTFSIPSTPPPYNPSVHNESHGLLYREARKIVYLVNELSEGTNLTQIKRESLFIQMLEAVDREDAKLLVRMLSKTPYPELPVEVIIEAFGPIISDPVPVAEVKRGRGRPRKVV